MHEPDLHLDLVRRQLPVGRRRAETICAELRSHLEAQAREFEREGVDPEQAMARAIARFGEPKEIAARLVAPNAHFRRQELLKAMWLGLIAGSAVFYAFAVIMYLLHLQSVHGVTMWRMNVAIGGTIGGLSGLAMCVFGVRLRIVAQVVAGVAAVFWIGFTAVQYAMNAWAYSGPWEVFMDFLPIGGVFVVAIAATALAAGYAVNRWVTGSGETMATERER